MCVNSAVENICVFIHRSVCTASISSVFSNKNSNKLFPSLKASNNLLGDFQRSLCSADSTDSIPIPSITLQMLLGSLALPTLPASSALGILWL